MSQKQMRDIAIVLLVVFIAAVIMYPMAFGPGNTDDGQAPVEAVASPADEVAQPVENVEPPADNSAPAAQ